MFTCVGSTSKGDMSRVKEKTLKAFEAGRMRKDYGDACRALGLDYATLKTLFPDAPHMLDDKLGELCQELINAMNTTRQYVGVFNAFLVSTLLPHQCC